MHTKIEEPQAMFKQLNLENDLLKKELISLGKIFPVKVCVCNTLSSIQMNPNGESFYCTESKQAFAGVRFYHVMV